MTTKKRSDLEWALSGHRYVVEPGGSLQPSVTTIIKQLGINPLIQAAANVTAEFALETIGIVQNEPEYDELRYEYRRRWDERSALGTCIHSLAEKIARGYGGPLWRPICSEAAGGYVAAIVHWHEDFEPEWLEVEPIMLSPQWGYGGRSDGFAIVNHPITRERVLACNDWKTGKYYLEEPTLQLSAYIHARHIGVYDDDGILLDLRDAPQATVGMTTHLHDDGTYTATLLPADEYAFEAFLSLRSIYTWRKNHEAWTRRLKKGS